MTWDWQAPSRDVWELRLQRLALALLLAVRLPALPRYASQPFPAGIATWIDFSFLADAAWRPWIDGVFAAALALYVLGRAMPLALGALAALWIGHGALANSQGGVGHETQLLGLVLLAQWLAYARAALARRRATVPARAAGALAVDYTMQVIAAAYVLAAMMKVLVSRGQWVMQIPWMASDLVKLHGQEFASTGDAGLPARGAWLASVLLSHPYLARLLIGPTLLLELCAPLALYGRRTALLIGIALIAMHRGIDWLMLIRFNENQALLWIYFVNVPWLLSRFPPLKKSGPGGFSEPKRSW